MTPSRTTVLAAVDGGPATERVLSSAQALAVMLDSRCRAVHAGESQDGERSDWARTAAAAAGVDLELVGGDVGPALQEALSPPGVVAGVLGVRTRSEEPKPAGHIALWLLPRIDRPLLLVPPDGPALGCPPRTVLLPLDGAISGGRAIAGAVGPLLGSGTRVVVLHAFTAQTVPMFWEGSAQELEAWVEEFLARSPVPPGARLVLRRGGPGEHVIALAQQERPDLVVVAWRQDLSPDHADVVRRLLTVAPSPLLVVPESWRYGDQATVARPSAAHG